MKKIPLTQGMFATIDDEDYDLVSLYRWYLVVPLKAKLTHLRYAASKSNKDRKTILMHRLILSAPKGLSVDHIDGDGLNNVKSNIRLCTVAENNRNSKIHRTNTTGFRGVAKQKQNNNFRAYIGWENRQIHIGCFDTPEEAAVARNKKALELYGEFAALNKI